MKHHLKALFKQFSSEVRIPQFVGKIPGQRQHPHALCIELLQLLDLSLADCSLLHGEQCGQLAFSFISLDVGILQHLSDQSLILLHLPFIQLVQSTQLLPGISVL